MQANLGKKKNYSNTIIDNVYQDFNASLRAQEYCSGGSSAYQRGFHVVLMAVFLTNIFVLVYFIANRGFVTDFSEPPNLFALAVNSPPSTSLRGACGAGPEGQQYAVRWGVEMEGEHLYIASKGNTNPYPKGGGGARGESKLSFGDLLGRRKWKSVPLQPDNIELGGHSTGYAPPTQQQQQQQEQFPAPAARNDGEDQNLMQQPPGSRESNISRMYSKFAKRNSVL
jgi:hypothetical protein